MQSGTGWRGVEKIFCLFFLCLMVKCSRNKNNAFKGNFIKIISEQIPMAYLDRLNAAIYLSEQVQQSSIKKSSQKLLIWLRDNHAFKNLTVFGFHSKKKDVSPITIQKSWIW